MNIKKLATLVIAAAVALVSATPMTASAATSSADKTKIKSLSKQLNKLPNGGATYNQVNKLVTKLSKLDPKKAAKYYKTGLKKLAPSPSQQTDAAKLAKNVNKSVQKSGLSESEIAKITGKVDKEETKVPPYQAYVPATLDVVFA